MLDKRQWLQLALMPGFGAAACAALLGAEPAVASAQLARARHAVPEARLQQLLRELEQLSATALTPACADYPPRLRELPDPPPVLFVRGQLHSLQRPQLAIVGSRRASRRALSLARDFARGLAAAGFVITSGLARGIDGAAHEGALDAGQSTIAVLGCGIDRVYPASHRALALRIREQGALVTEFAPGAPPLRDHFPRRNRLVSGLCWGVLVVEAAARSGSLITARLAGEQGRDLFALPGLPTDPGMLGCHRLIQQGAKLVTCVEDVLEDYEGRVQTLAPAAASAERHVGLPAPTLSAVQQSVLEALDVEGTPFDLLVQRTGLPADRLSAELVHLELLGMVVREGALHLRLTH